MLGTSAAVDARRRHQTALLVVQVVAAASDVLAVKPADYCRRAVTAVRVQLRIKVVAQLRRVITARVVVRLRHRRQQVTDA